MIKTINGKKCRVVKAGYKLKATDLFECGEPLGVGFEGIKEEPCEDFLRAWRPIATRAKPGTGKKKQAAINPREKLLSTLAYFIGGWNASLGTSSGRLRAWDCYEEDEAIVKILLDAHKSNIANPLEQEILKLKAEVYGLKEKK